MMMKNKYIIVILLFLGVGLLSSCVQEMDEIFEDSASARLENEVNKYRELLTQPQNGWLMEYYPGGRNQAYGGYVITAKFSDDGNVLIQSVLAQDITESEVSQYTVGKDMGATLNFVTYNELFHYFSDPDIGTIGTGLGSGMTGDYEFVFETGDAGEIVLTGKKHRSVIYMYPLAQTASEYLIKTKNNMDSFTGIPAAYGLTGTFEGEPAEAEFISRQSVQITQGDETTNFSFMFNDEGVKLYNPISLNDKKVCDLIWNPQNRTFSSTDGNTILQVLSNPAGLLLEDLLGDYTLSMVTTSIIFDITISQDDFGNIVMEGLPFNLYLTYNWKLGVLELTPQYVMRSPDVVTAIWSARVGPLTWGAGYGLVTKWNGSDDDFVLEFVDNGYEWFSNGERIYADGFILWDMNASGEYTGFGLSQYVDLMLTKK